MTDANGRSSHSLENMGKITLSITDDIGELYRLFDHASLSFTRRRSISVKLGLLER